MRSSGPGSSLHLFAEMFKVSAGVDIVHIPYRGDAPMITAMIAGDVQLAFLPQATGLAAIQGKQVRPLAVTGRKRMTQLPDVPTVQEQGVAGFEEGSWNGMWVPAGTPPDIVLALQQSMAKVLADPQVRERLLSVGQEPVGNTPAEFEAQFKADITRYAKIIETGENPEARLRRVSRVDRGDHCGSMPASLTTLRPFDDLRGEELAPSRPACWCAARSRAR